MLKKIEGIKSIFLVLATVLLNWILTGMAYAGEVTENSGLTTAGVREVVIAGLIIAFLTAVYSIILTQKGEEEGGESCGCGRKSKYT